MKKSNTHKQRPNWGRLGLTILVGGVFCAFLLIAIWQSQSDQEILANSEMLIKNPAKNDVIQVTAPKINAQIKSPVQLSGQAAVFETQLRARIKDASGLTLAEAQLVAKKGQTMVPFSAKIKYKKPSRNEGLVEVFEISAKDGSEIHKISIPVIFQD
jgi:hypothetical protein